MATVTATYVASDGVTPCRGSVVFKLVAATYHDGLDAIFPQVPTRGVLDDTGAMAVDLLPTSGDDMGFDAADMTYQVTEKINAATRDVYYIDVPSVASVDLGTLATYADPPTVVRQLHPVDTGGFDFQDADPTLVITYNGDGTVDTVTEAGVLTTFTYNPDGTVATHTRAGVTRDYTYDGDQLVSVA